MLGEKNKVILWFISASHKYRNSNYWVWINQDYYNSKKKSVLLFNAVKRRQHTVLEMTVDIVKFLGKTQFQWSKNIHLYWATLHKQIQGIFPDLSIPVHAYMYMTFSPNHQFLNPLIKKIKNQFVGSKLASFH